MLDADLMKYLHSSVIRHIKPTIDSMDIQFYVEGLDEEIESAFENDSALLRINGPWYYPLNSVDYYRVELMVLMTELSGISENKYKLMDNIGKVANKLSEIIPVNRHGDGGELISCLQTDREAREFVRIVNYGVIEKDYTVRQMSAIARYEISF